MLLKCILNKSIITQDGEGTPLPAAMICHEVIKDLSTDTGTRIRQQVNAVTEHLMSYKTGRNYTADDSYVPTSHSDDEILLQYFDILMTGRQEILTQFVRTVDFLFIS